MISEKRINTDASRAVAHNLRSESGIRPQTGGNYLLHKPCSYGIAMKWLLFVKGIKYRDFAKAYNGSTSQNINYLINRTRKELFYPEDIDKICEILEVDSEYFYALSERIEELSNGKTC